MCLKVCPIRGVLRTFAKGGTILMCRGGKKNDLYFSPRILTISMQILHFAIFLDILRIQEGQILPPLALPGGGIILNKYGSFLNAD